MIQPLAVKPVRSSLAELSRRDLLSGVAAAGLGFWLAPAAPALAFQAPPAFRVVAEEPFGRIEQLAEGVWAVVSTPLEHRDMTTLCNGGLVAGKERVLAIETFAGVAGARWVGGKARELAGRWPTDVVISHHHGDHANGLLGFAADAGARPRLWISQKTRELILGAAGGAADTDEGAAMKEWLEAATVIDPASPTELDLGGKKVSLRVRSGHTPSDVTVEVAGASVAFSGDLVWNQMFPNYVDAIPTRFAASVRELTRVDATTWVPGHGPLATASDVVQFAGLIDSVEVAARSGIERGIAAAAAAVEYRLPAAFAAWTLFNPRYFETAISAWYRELGA